MVSKGLENIHQIFIPPQGPSTFSTFIAQLILFITTNYSPKQNSLLPIACLVKVSKFVKNVSFKVIWKIPKIYERETLEWNSSEVDSDQICSQ